jgi:hypothetical protein
LGGAFGFDNFYIMVYCNVYLRLGFKSNIEESIMRLGSDIRLMERNAKKEERVRLRGLLLEALNSYGHCTFGLYEIKGIVERVFAEEKK